MPLVRTIRFARGDFPLSAVGGYTTADDDEAIWQWVLGALTTNPSEYRHNLAFGVGVPSFLKKPDTPTNRAELSRRIRDSLLMHPRIVDVVGVGFDWRTLATGVRAFQISISVVWDGATRSNAFNFPAGGAT